MTTLITAAEETTAHPTQRLTEYPPKQGAEKSLTSGRGIIYLGIIYLGCNKVVSFVNESEIANLLSWWFSGVKFTSEGSYTLITN